MQIQSVNATSFGKIGQQGGKLLGRGRKSSTLAPNHGKIGNSYKAQIKQTYNSMSDRTLADELTEISDKIKEKTVLLKKKILPKK